MITIDTGLHIKYPILIKTEFSRQFFEKYLKSNFMKICHVGDELFRGDRRKERQTNMPKQFNVHGSVHRKNFLVYIQQDATLHSLFYLETAQHVSGGTSTHLQEHTQLYLQHLVFVTPLLLSAAIAADSSNSMTNTRCCRYSCMRS